MTDCETLVERYLNLLKDGFRTQGLTMGACRITTPFLNPIGDHVEVVITPGPDGQIMVSDSGSVFDYLFLAGMSPESVRRHPDLSARLAANGLTLDGEEIVATCPEQEIPRAVHRVVHAITALQYLQYTIRPHTQSTFKDRVLEFIRTEAPSVVATAEITGKSRKHKFDFAFDAKPTPYFGRSYSTQSSQYARLLAFDLWFAVTDVSDLSPRPVQYVTVINDEAPEFRGAWQEEEYYILKDKAGAAVYEWSRRRELVEMLESV